MAPKEEEARGVGLAEFANRVLKTPHATTPMRPTRGGRAEAGDGSEEDEVEAPSVFGTGGDDPTALQRLEDSVGLLHGELGVCGQDARYLTLHGGVGALGDELDLVK